MKTSHRAWLVMFESRQGDPKNPPHSRQDEIPGGGVGRTSRSGQAQPLGRAFGGGTSISLKTPAKLLLVASSSFLLAMASNLIAMAST